mmetsp:Transcript_61172/g.192458  ORF Transcript_61172/g.192458 Transcript_61172/m.192458 type:complete len:273 (-) Transcript_61172:12-830(-)
MASPAQLPELRRAVLRIPPELRLGRAPGGGQGLPGRGLLRALAAEGRDGSSVEVLAPVLTEHRVVVVPDDHRAAAPLVHRPLRQVPDTRFHSTGRSEDVHLVLHEQRHGASGRVAADEQAVGVHAEVLGQPARERSEVRYVAGVAPFGRAWHLHIWVDDKEAPCVGEGLETDLEHARRGVKAAVQHDDGGTPILSRRSLRNVHPGQPALDDHIGVWSLKELANASWDHAPASAEGALPHQDEPRNGCTAGQRADHERHGSQHGSPPRPRTPP